MGGNLPKISVVIPVYNAEKYLEQCLDSIVLQTYENLEIILVNDGSTDGSAKIMQKYAANDARIKIISTQNQGGSLARNAGIAKATGEYLSILDADDYISLGLYQKFINVILNTERPIDIFVFNGLSYSEKQLMTHTNLHATYAPNDWGDIGVSAFKNYYQHCNPALNPCPAWNKIYRKSWFDEHGFRFQKLAIAQDRPFSAATFLATENIYIYDDYLHFYRVHKNSILHMADERILDIFKSGDMVEQIYKEHDFFEHAKYSLCDRLLADIKFGLMRCRADLVQRVYEEGVKRLNQLMPHLNAEKLRQLSNYTTYTEMQKFSPEQLKIKYQHEDI